MRAKDRLGDVQMANFALMDEVEKLKATLASNDAKFTKFDARKKLDEAQTVAEELRAENDHLKMNVASLKENFPDLVQRVGDLIKQCEESEALIDDLRSENTSLKKAAIDVDAMKQEIAAMEEMHGKSVALCNQLRAGIVYLKNEMIDVDAVKAELSASNQKLKDAFRKSDEAEALCNQLQLEVLSLKQEAAMMKVNVDSAKLDDDVIQKAQLYDKLLSEKTAKIKLFYQMKSENNKLKDEKAELQSLYSLKEIELLELKDATEKDKEDREKLQDAREKLKQEIETLNDQLEAADEAQKDSNEQLFRLSAKLSKMKCDGNAPYRAAIDLAEALSQPPILDCSIADGDETLQDTPKDDSEIRKHKEDIGSKLANPFRRKRERSSSPHQNISSCNQQ